MKEPKLAWNEIWMRNRRTRTRVAVDQEKRRPILGLAGDAPAVATAVVAPAPGARASAAGFGRNSEPTNARALVALTTRNGKRRSAIPTSSPPTVGPRTDPAEPAAERTPFAKANLVRSIAWATYSRSDTWFTPAPRPATERKAMSGRAAPAVEIRTLAAA